MVLEFHSYSDADPLVKSIFQMLMEAGFSRRCAQLSSDKNSLLP